MRIALVGGGTGGHVYPNFALLNGLKTKFDKVFYIGEKGKLEERLSKEKDIPFYSIVAPKLIRGKIIENFTILHKFFSAVKQAVEILEEIKPNVIFCKGGYVCLPVVVAARGLDIPCVLHESDKTYGLANKLSYPFCQKALLGFPKKLRKKEEYVGNPIREELLTGTKISFFNNRRPTVLFLGGSLGAKEINDIAKDFYLHFKDNFNVLLVSGKTGANLAMDGFLEMTYCDNMGDLLNSCDFIVSRGGANALTEIITLKKPSVIFPLLSSVSRGDQIDNAKYYSKMGLIFLHNHKLRKIQDISEEIADFYYKKAHLCENLANFNFPKSNELIIKNILDCVKNHI
ncbi:MAG: UDP-N-acetylglucosamine--N-acetylmuramyl-(pentapeptide) pyrophosphoryl-undecaprenol N-acetylglucosamine transferase [Clostridia bacterium]|nr:UDP-N-acetylglucosamine--N-acetylmuramyl-(pentapeptide) pyrophosphoryl-undecaprenol N-acetylglucosamine transferase [Clostridia bacterium]